MKYLLLIACFFTISFAVNSINPENTYQNATDNLLSKDGKLVIGGYGEVHYNHPLSDAQRNNEVLDVRSVVLLLGYNFNARTQLISEFGFEHLSEVFLEQVFLQHKINNFINFRAGLMFIPMGIINEHHQPNTFNGVERPMLDSKLLPSTWREVGIGFSGNVLPASIKYQLYLVNGFNGYRDGEATLSGNNGFRLGRPKSADSYISSPVFTAKVEYYGISGLNLGLSGYLGNTQSTLYNGLDKTNTVELAKADSSVVHISMVGIDARYNLGGLQLRGQAYYSAIENTEAYNKFTSNSLLKNDLGSANLGYYVEAGYNVLSFVWQAKSELTPFVRYESYDTHYSTAGSLRRNKAYNNNIITSGLTYKLTKGLVLKADIQLSKSVAETTYSKTLNAGVGVVF